MKIKLIDFGYDAKPCRKHYNDTGADIYMLDDVVIEPHQTVVIPTGFGLELPNGLNANIQARTSIARQGIMVHQCAIDAGYRGQINMIVTNLSDAIQIIKAGDRLAYLQITPCIYADFVEELGEERGDGAFGSTNK